MCLKQHGITLVVNELFMIVRTDGPITPNTSLKRHVGIISAGEVVSFSFKMISYQFILGENWFAGHCQLQDWKNQRVSGLVRIIRLFVFICTLKLFKKTFSLIHNTCAFYNAFYTDPYYSALISQLYMRCYSEKPRSLSYSQ